MSRISVLPTQATTGFGSITWANEPPSDAERAKVKAERSLLRAILNGESAEFQRVLKENGDVIDLNFESSGKMTPLHTAMAYGRNDMVETILSKKAEVSAQNSLGFTPLVSAVHNGHEQCVQIAIKAGANKLIKTYRGDTPLQIAESKNFQNIVSLLK